MIILPNSFERYLKSLRIYTSFSIAKQGLKPKHIKNLRKIELAEGFLYKTDQNATAIKLLSVNLLSCISAIKPSFNFSVNINHNVLINKKLYVILIIMLSNNSDFLNIGFKNGILIKGKGKIKNCLSVIEALKGIAFFDLKTNKFLIFLPCEKTDKAATHTESQWHFIFDRFSLLNLFINP
ncbi:MAG: hypothetical protein IKV81_00240 [Clostridia bacterium]|nr:hypothetical protein [Clostridia bacterium]